MLSSNQQERMVEAYILLRQGRSRQLVLTSAALAYGSQAPACTRQMDQLGFTYPVLVTGPVRDTHDEALAVAGMARQRGWSQVILVTHPWHMRRAAGAFEKAGLKVLRAPCVEGEYDRLDLTPDNRLHAFRHWLHETVGYVSYRCRGWI
jgi:uncharacterized SAM-binding protein YcdF (DUF218 family)